MTPDLVPAGAQCRHARRRRRSGCGRSLRRAGVEPRIFSQLHTDPSLRAGEVDLTTLGVPDTAFATVGPSTTASSSGDGPNMYIVDNDRVQCPNAAFTSIQAAVNASGPGDRIRVCPGLYLEQVDIGPGHDGLTVFSQQPLQAIIKAPPVMSEPGDIVRIHDVQDVTLRHFESRARFPTTSSAAPDEDGSAHRRGRFSDSARQPHHRDPVHEPGVAWLPERHRGPWDAASIRLAGQPALPARRGSRKPDRQIPEGRDVVDNQDSFATIDHNKIVGQDPNP